MSHSTGCIKVAFLVGSIAVLLAFGGLFGQNGTSGSFPAASSQLLETFSVESASSGTFPFDRMVVLPDGAGNGVTVDTPISQSECVGTYPSGSCRLSQIAGIVTLTAGVPLEIDVYSGQQAQGTALTVADIDAAAPASVVDMGAYGSASLAALDLTSPVKVWYAGPEMITAEYQTVIGTDVSVIFFVTLFSDDRVRVWGKVTNILFGTLVVGDVDGNFNTTYEKVFTPDFSVGGATVWDNGGAPFTFYELSAIAFTGWIGGDPDLTIIHDKDALIATGAVPEYWRTAVPESRLASYTEVYAPNDNTYLESTMGNAGYQRAIGQIPNWDADCIVTADPRACKASVVASLSLDSFPMNFLDENTSQSVKPSDRPLWTNGGFKTGSTGTIYNGSGLSWDGAHHPHVGYLAFLLTGNPMHYLTVRNQTSLAAYLIHPWQRGEGVNRIYVLQTRDRAWAGVSLAQLSVIARPDDPIAQEYKTLLDINITEQYAETQLPGQNPDTGFYYNYRSGDTCYAVDSNENCHTQTFMQDFLVGATGFINRVDVLADETDLHGLLEWSGNIILFRGGAGGSDEFCYNILSVYEIPVAHPYAIVPGGIANDTTLWNLTPKEIYDARCTSSHAPITCDAPLTACNNTFRTPVGHTGYLAGYTTALAGLLEHSGTRERALGVLGRLKGTTDWPAHAADTTSDIVWSIGDPADFN